MALPLAAAAAALAVAPEFEPPKPAFRGPDIATEADEKIFHPLVPVIAGKLAAPVTTDQRKAVLLFRLNWLKGRRSAAEQALLDNGFKADLPTKMVKKGATGWPLAGITIRRKWLQSRLDLKQDEPRGANDSEIIDSDLSNRAYTNTTDAFSRLATNAVDDVAADTTGHKAAHLLLQIRCLGDVYTRWEVAARAAQIVRSSQFSSPDLTAKELLARALTLWRVEGDLSVPPENDTLEGSDTPAGTTPSVPLPPGRTRFDYLLAARYRGQMAAVTYLVKAPTPPEANWRGVWDGSVIEAPNFFDQPTAARWGDLGFSVALGGLDILWLKETQIRAEQIKAADLPFSPADDLTWAALNRKGADPHGEVVHDRDRRRALLAGITKNQPIPAVAAVRVACISSITYVALPGSTFSYSGPAAEYSTLVLKEALSYMNRLTLGSTRFGAGVTTRVPEMLVYVFYHLGHKAKAMLASAAAHAVRPASTSAAAQQLKAALPADARHASGHLGGFLKDIRIASPDDAVTKAILHWDELGPMLGADAVAKALNNYIKTEGLTVWKSWAKPDAAGMTPRGNVIAYDNLYQHHLQLFS